MKKFNPIDIEAIIREKGIELDKHAELPRDVLGLIKKENGKYKILINTLDHYYRKRFTMAHELGHYELHRNAIDENGIDESWKYRTLYRRNNKITQTEEAAANRFAADILMPDDSVLEYARDRGVLSMQDGIIVEDALKELAIAFQVSTEVMKYKINKLRDKIS